MLRRSTCSACCWRTVSRIAGQSCRCMPADEWTVVTVCSTMYCETTSARCNSCTPLQRPTTYRTHSTGRSLRRLQYFSHIHLHHLTHAQPPPSHHLLRPSSRPCRYPRAVPPRLPPPQPTTHHTHHHHHHHHHYHPPLPARPPVHSSRGRHSRRPAATHSQRMGTRPCGRRRAGQAEAEGGGGHEGVRSEGRRGSGAGGG